MKTFLVLLSAAILLAFKGATQIPQSQTIQSRKSKERVVEKLQKAVRSYTRTTDTANVPVSTFATDVITELSTRDELPRKQRRHLESIIDDASKDATITTKEELLEHVRETIESEKVTDLTSELPFVAVSGLGNVASVKEKVGVDPSANIQVSMSLSHKKRWRTYFGYNIAGAIDTTSSDSVSMSALFFPDKSKNGFYIGTSFDLLRIFYGNKTPSLCPNMERAELLSEDEIKQYFFVVDAYAEYYYLKKQLKNTTILVPRIETSTFLWGLRAGGVVNIGANSFGLFLNPYFKYVFITDATLDTYREVFRADNKGVDPPQKVNFFGLNINFQINKTILGFSYEELLNNDIGNKDIWGGVYVLKATIAADFFNFN